MNRKELREIGKEIRKFIHSMEHFTWEHRNASDSDKMSNLLRLLEISNPTMHKKVKSLVDKGEFCYADAVKLIGFDPSNPDEYNDFITRSSAYRNGKVYKETRDNKSYPNYGSGAPGNHNATVRYPSKKRSVRTWRNFYAIFPYLVKIDGWDGKTSKKYNK